MPDKNTEEKNVELLESLSKGLALLRLFATGVPSMTIQEVAAELDVTRAAARRLLLTLEHHGYVTQNGRLFSITPRVIELGYAYFASMDLPTLAKPAMRELADTVKETCSLGVLDGEFVAMIAREEPQRLLRLDLGVGRRLPAYVHSLGRQLLAALDDATLEQYLKSADIRKLTPLTVSKAALERSLKQIRNDGYCVVVDEIVEGIGGVSVPVRNREGVVVAAMCVSMVLGNRSKERIVKDYLAPLQRAAQSVEKMLHAIHS
ncbi:MAG: IclR family transcriptional regulator, pca regulon regulatory protein [Burkholderiales bacterium]|jgi:IclR family pca regulon transcriptional regulator